jgi:hypothetical protein
MSQASRRQFQSSKKILRSFQLSKSWIFCFGLDNPVKRPNALLCREDSDSSACIRPNVRATPSGRSSVFEKNPNFLYRHGLGRQLATIQTLGQHRPDVALIRKRMKCVMERQCQSSPPREIQIKLNLGLLSL